MEHGARSTRKIEILYEKKYSHFTNLLHILSLLITNFSLLRVRKIGYYPYIRGIELYFIHFKRAALCQIKSKTGNLLIQI